MLAVEALLVGRHHEEVDQVDGQRPSDLKAERGDRKRSPEVLLDPELVDPGEGRRDAAAEDDDERR